MDKIFTIVVLGAFAIGIVVGIAITSAITIKKPVQKTAETEIPTVDFPGPKIQHVLYGQDGRFWIDRDGKWEHLTK